MNRRDLLEQSLRSLQAQTCAADRFEILVVDNGSTDGTRQLVESLSREMPNLRCVDEPKRGLSNARNRGIAEARADLVGFFDDDAVAEPDWIEVLLEIFEREPDAGAGGGRIYVRWPGPRPEWMPVSLEGYYGRCDYGPERSHLSFPQYPYGSNMVIRRDLLLAIGGFNGRLGPTGGDLMSGGETELFYRLYQKPITVVYDPRALVHHYAPPERVTRAWILKRALKHGMASTRMAQTAEGPRGRAHWARLALNAVFQTVDGAFSAALALAFRQPPPVLTSRAGMMCYRAGIARGAIAKLFRS